MVCYKIYPELPAEVAKDGSVPENTIIPKLPLDVNDGYYHLSVRGQVAGVLNRYFESVTEVYIAHINLPDDKSVTPAEGELGSRADARLQWDQVTLKATGEVTYFPHIYGDITNKDVLKVETVTKKADGTWEF